MSTSISDNHDLTRRHHFSICELELSVRDRSWNVRKSLTTDSFLSLSICHPRRHSKSKSSSRLLSSYPKQIGLALAPTSFVATGHLLPRPSWLVFLLLMMPCLLLVSDHFVSLNFTFFNFIRYSLYHWQVLKNRDKFRSSSNEQSSICTVYI